MYFAINFNYNANFIGAYGGLCVVFVRIVGNVKPVLSVDVKVICGLRRLCIETSCIG